MVDFLLDEAAAAGGRARRGRRREGVLPADCDRLLDPGQEGMIAPF